MRSFTRPPGSRAARERNRRPRRWAFQPAHIGLAHHGEPRRLASIERAQGALQELASAAEVAGARRGDDSHRGRLEERGRRVRQRGTGESPGSVSPRTG